jgi:two-component system NtrC family response regulator
MDSESQRILLVDDDESIRRVTRYHLEQAGHEVVALSSAEEALAELEEQSVSLLITDVQMPGLSGLDLLRRVKARWPEVGVLVITAHGSIEDAVEAMRIGASDYLVKPFEHAALRLSVEKALRLSQLLRENERLRELARSSLRFEGMIATSSAMKEVLETAARVAPRNTTVLLLGESGTGKELMARAIHQASSRSEGPFVAVGVGALPETLIDAELFGYRKGAFTGADSHKQGRFVLAQGGSLFLDEIGDLRIDLQVKLLRVLQESEVDPLGADRTVPVDVRVIAATNRDLESMVRNGEFREDLYYRLAVLPLDLPPLRQRKDDIGPLVHHFASRISEREGQKSPDFAPEVMSALLDYEWPGNVRELENVIERALVLNSDGPIRLEDLPPRLRLATGEKESILGPLPEEGLSLEQVEKELIERALDKCGGNQSRTARYLRISRNTLLYRMEKHGLR